MFCNRLNEKCSKLKALAIHGAEYIMTGKNEGLGCSRLSRGGLLL